MTGIEELNSGHNF